MSAQPSSIFPDQLAEARAAWRAKQAAESKLAHLRRYAGQSPAMKDEAAKACARLHQAEATLQRVLGGAL